MGPNKQDQSNTGEAESILKQRDTLHQFIQECTECQAEIEPDWQSCAHCGTRLDTSCPSCGNPLPPAGSQLCPHCGLAIPEIGT